MRDLNHMVVFAKVAEAKNFTEASHLLGLTSSAVSKIITRFEAELGVRLFNRTTRTVHLTNDGAAFLERCREVLAAVDDAEENLRQTTSAPRGTIRITMPVGFGHKVVAPALPSFAIEYPEIIVEAEMSDRVVDLGYEPIDLAIMREPVPDARLIAKRLCSLQFIPCASPEYLARHGVPREPEDLARHHCLAYMGPQMSRYRDWTFTRNGRPFSITLSGRVNTNSATSLLEASLAGLGICMLSTLYTADAIRSGKLVMLLTDYLPPAMGVSVVYLPNRSLSQRMRKFIDFLSRLVPPAPPWEMLATPPPQAQQPPHR